MCPDTHTHTHTRRRTHTYAHIHTSGTYGSVRSNTHPHPHTVSQSPRRLDFVIWILKPFTSHCLTVHKVRANTNTIHKKLGVCLARWADRQTHTHTHTQYGITETDRGDPPTNCYHSIIAEQPLTASILVIHQTAQYHFGVLDGYIRADLNRPAPGLSVYI